MANDDEVGAIRESPLQHTSLARYSPEAFDALLEAWKPSPEIREMEVALVRLFNLDRHTISSLLFSLELATNALGIRSPQGVLLTGLSNGFALGWKAREAMMETEALEKFVKD